MSLDAILGRILFILLVIFYFVKCDKASADQYALYCEYKGHDLIFTADIDPKAISIRRMFEYNNGDTIHVFIPNFTPSSDMQAELDIENAGVLTKKEAKCFSVTK